MTPGDAPSITDWIGALSNAALAVAAGFGVSAWRAQLRGGAEFEAARHFLRAAMKYRELFLFVRDRVMLIPPSSTDRGSDDAIRDATIKAYERRWLAADKVMEELEVTADEARVFWNERVDELLRPIRQAREDLQFRLIDLTRILKSPHANPQEEHEFRRVFFGSVDPPDDLTKKLRAAVTAIEEFSRPIVRGGRRAG